MHQLTQELMRDNLQIELEALKVSPLESIKVGLERALDLEIPRHQLIQELLHKDLKIKLEPLKLKFKETVKADLEVSLV